MTTTTGNKAETIVFLRSLAPDWSEDELEALYKKFNGDSEKCANAIFEPDIKSKLAPVKDIALTEDDDEMHRALQLSLKSNKEPLKLPAPTFGPSNRAPDTNWAMTVSSSTTTAQEESDKQLQEALKRSMAEIPVEEDPIDVTGLDIPFRDLESGQPLAIHAHTSNLQYASNLVQALMQIPQIQLALRFISSTPAEPNTPLHMLIDYASHQDHAHLAFLANATIINHAACVPTNDFERIQENSKEMYTAIIRDIEGGLEALGLGPPPRQNLGSMQIVTMSRQHDRDEVIKTTEPLPHVVPLSFGKTDIRDDINDLIFQLLSQEAPDGTWENILLKTLPDIVAISLKNEGKSAEAPLVQQTLYMDRYLIDNADIAHAQVLELAEISRRRLKLYQKREILTKNNGNDSIKDIQTTLRYYEEVASGRENAERKENIDTMITKLKNVLQEIEQQLADIEKDLEGTLEGTQKAHERPDMRNHAYDLRAVLVSGGPPSRKNLYSYVQDAQQRWWKVVDTSVTESSYGEIVHDSNGVLLGAGPYMLLYSRRMSEEEMQDVPEWPHYLTDPIRSNNELYIEARNREGTGISRDVSMLDLS